MSSELIQGPSAAGTARDSLVWELVLLGGWFLRCEGRGECVPGVNQRVLAFIALHQPCDRVQVAGSLWPTVDDHRALGNLRSVLWRLHRSLPGLVVVAGQALSLGQHVSVDVHELENRLGRVQSLELPVRWLRLSDGDLLPGWYEDWVLVERERLRQLRLHGLEELATSLCQRRRYGEALQAALRALSCEPLRESAHRVVIEIHLAEGNVSEAIRQYSACCNLLWEELRVRPSPRLRQLSALAHG